MMFAHGDIHQRIEAASQQIASAPKDARLYVRRAELFRQHEDWQATLADCDTAQALDPAIDVALLRGRALFESGHPGTALALLDGFVSRHPDHPQARVCRARVLTQLGRHAAAIADLRGALQMTPVPQPELVQECADALAAQGRHQEAVLVLAAGIDTLGAIPSLVVRAMELEIATRDFDAALKRVEAMRQCAPRPEPWMAKRASILAQAGRLGDARAAWQALVEHLAALPNLERGSHAMSTLMEQATQALAALASIPADR